MRPAMPPASAVTSAAPSAPRNMLSTTFAEMNAAWAAPALGIVPTVRHADYLASWLEVLREDNRAIVRAASQASKAADWPLAFLPQPDGAARPGPADVDEAEIDRRAA